MYTRRSGSTAKAVEPFVDVIATDPWPVNTAPRAGSAPPALMLQVAPASSLEAMPLKMPPWPSTV